MSSQAYAERLARALEGTGLCETVSANFSENTVGVLCRVKADNEKKWAELLTKMLIASEDESKEVHAWKCHFCRRYFLKEVGGDRKMVYGWNFTIQSNEMSISMDMLMMVIKGQPIRITNNRELDEFPLHGASADRNTPKGGKGVQYSGQGDFHPLRSK